MEANRYNFTACPFDELPYPMVKYSIIHDPHKEVIHFGYD